MFLDFISKVIDIDIVIFCFEFFIISRVGVGNDLIGVGCIVFSRF